ncbi:MAG: family 1 glycosylhydrolase [Anaerobutyricum sp.]|nr:family 1 glycosylhydrolase [Eubacterium sp.]MDY6046811.1 family 1 glycosylhydrolase [Anaerobutyricum sp.]
MDLVTKGCLPQDVLDTLAEEGAPAPIRPGDEGILAQGKVDWLGFNYYQPTRVQAPKNKVDANGNPVFSEPYIWPERRINKSRGWEIYPKGIYDFGMKLKEDYPNLTFFISENGMGVEKEDAFRNADGVIELYY